MTDQPVNDPTPEDAEPAPPAYAQVAPPGSGLREQLGSAWAWVLASDRNKGIFAAILVAAVILVGITTVAATSGGAKRVTGAATAHSDAPDSTGVRANSLRGRGVVDVSDWRLPGPANSDRCDDLKVFFAHNFAVVNPSADVAAIACSNGYGVMFGLEDAWGVAIAASTGSGMTYFSVSDDGHARVLASKSS